MMKPGGWVVELEFNQEWRPWDIFDTRAGAMRQSRVYRRKGWRARMRYYIPEEGGKTDGERGTETGTAAQAPEGPA